MLHYIAQNFNELLAVSIISVLISSILTMITIHKYQSPMGAIIKEFKKMRERLSYDWFRDLKLVPSYDSYSTSAFIKSVKVNLFFTFDKDSRTNKYFITVDFRKWATYEKLSYNEYEMFLKKLDNKINSIREWHIQKIPSLIKHDAVMLNGSYGVHSFENFSCNGVITFMKIIVEVIESFPGEVAKWKDMSKLEFHEDIMNICMRSMTDEEIQEADREKLEQN